MGLSSRFIRLGDGSLFVYGEMLTYEQLARALSKSFFISIGRFETEQTRRRLDSSFTCFVPNPLREIPSEEFYRWSRAIISATHEEALLAFATYEHEDGFNGYGHSEFWNPASDSFMKGQVSILTPYGDVFFRARRSLKARREWKHRVEKPVADILQRASCGTF